MSCPAKQKGEVRERGQASIEYYDDNHKPVYYCHGWIDKKTDELIETCTVCRQNVRYAQEDLDRLLETRRRC